MRILESISKKLEAFGKSGSGGQTKGGVPDEIRNLFLIDLGWGSPRNLTPRTLPIGFPVSREVTVFPVAQMSGLPVYYIQWHENKLPGTTARRAVNRKLSEISADHLIIYTLPDRSQLTFTRARKRSDDKIELRTLPYEIGSPARTTIERLGELAFTLEELEHGEPPITSVTEKLNNAFNVEAVTEQFFNDYKIVFAGLQERLIGELPVRIRKSAEAKFWAHDYALQLLNRLMFLYFIQRKRWLGENPGFLRYFWRSYKDSGMSQNTFYSDWLSILFFKAFNNKPHNGYRNFPDNIRLALQNAPYLNGGLFYENELDTKYDITLPDEFFDLIFDRFKSSEPGFLERYNFTIAESTPLDIEVAVDPEMIGKVYESLINITFDGLTETDQRGSAGIFYTPRVEIDLMCRLSLVDALANRLGQDYKPLLYDAVFAIEPEEKEQADRAIAKRNLWRDLNAILRSITVCDPACGSGSFLVGMLLVLDDLQTRANAQLGLEETPYERRRRIIGSQLYGVDAMKWAVHVAELRLWLQLVVETELDPAELKVRPLLPNLTFKIRQGDSLVQEIADINFGLHRQRLNINPSLKGKVTQLKAKKLSFYRGDQNINEEAIKREEVALFREILKSKIFDLNKKISDVKNQIERLNDQGKLINISNDLLEKQEQEKESKLLAEKDELQAQLKRYQDVLDALKTVQDVPFVWDIAFVEIFEGDEHGFDIVIGNPPYVRQEKIAPPHEREQDYSEKQWRSIKDEYKQKLQLSVATAWQKFFRYNPVKNTFRKPDGKSDLYIYFYFHGLSLLNEKGSFCFITSNSWLDVGYGADLQEFLLKHSHVKLILDNEVKRSFAQADVNTIIALLAPPDDKKEWGLEKTARFVMFKVPFEDVLHADVFKQIETTIGRANTKQWRICVCPQRQLLEEGLGIGESDDDDEAHSTVTGGKMSGAYDFRTINIKTARYIGNKWGGKYLRAPDIFFTILEKGKGKLVRLGDIAEVRYGIKTGANEFFYLEPTGKPASKGCLHVRNAAGWEGEIEQEFLKPFLFSLKEVERYEVTPSHLERKVLLCSWTKEELRRQRKKGVLSYIEYGEKQGFDRRPSVKGRPLWYAIPEQNLPHCVSNQFLGERLGFPYLYNVLVCNVFFVATFTKTEALTGTALLNSIVSLLAAEVTSRKTYGIGVAYLYGPEIRALSVMAPDVLSFEDKQHLHETFSSMRKRAILKIADEIQQPDRRALDDMIFDVLGLTKGEREAVYEAVVNLVRARLEKAKSV